MPGGESTQVVFIEKNNQIKGIKYFTNHIITIRDSPIGIRSIQLMCQATMIHNKRIMSVFYSLSMNDML